MFPGMFEQRSPALQIPMVFFSGSECDLRQQRQSKTPNNTAWERAYRRYLVPSTDGRALCSVCEPLLVLLIPLLGVFFLKHHSEKTVRESSQCAALSLAHSANGRKSSKRVTYPRKSYGVIPLYIDPVPPKSKA